MNRLAWIVSLLAIGCGSDPQSVGADAGSDASPDVTKSCVVDFPCANFWSCADSTHWVEMQSVTKPPCSGLTCESTGVMHACDPGLECVSDALPGSTAPCTYGGHDGCLPADAGAFSPQPIGPAPTKQPGACSDAAVADVWSFCLDPATRDANKCSSVGKLYPSCGQCLAPTMTTVTITQNGDDWVPNVGACYALLDGTSAPGSCAAQGDANMQCAIHSCEACELWPDTFQTCVLAARKSSCAAFSICDGEAGASYATCEPTSLKDFFIGFGEALCGP